MKRLSRIIQHHRLAWMLLFVWSILPAVAQDDYNPTNPPEPQVRYKVTVNCTPAGAAYLSGNGQYDVGSSVYVNASRQSSSFIFQHWLKDGVEIDGTSTSFYHTMGDADVVYTAVFTYSPSSPSEPSTKEYSYPLYLTCSPEGACSFNRTSGEDVEGGTFPYVKAFANQSFDFLGWYQDGVLVSESMSINYEMPIQATTLTAKFVYNPVSPGEPAGGSQTDVDTANSPDVNGDGVVDVSDAVVVISVYLGNDTTTGLRADVNADGVVDVSDAVKVISVYLNK